MATKNRDAAAIAAAFARIPRTVKARIQPALDKGADEIVTRARYLAPDETGDLKANIRKEPGPHELSVTVVSDGEAALYQEYGTANMDRNPSFWPAVNTLKKRVRRRVDSAISRAVKEEFKR